MRFLLAAAAFWGNATVYLLSMGIDKKSVAEVQESILKDNLRRVAPGDEVGRMRAVKKSKALAGPLHRIRELLRQAQKRGERPF